MVDRLALLLTGIIGQFVVLPTPCWRDSMSVVIIASILEQDIKRCLFTFSFKPIERRTSVTSRYHSSKISGSQQ